MTLVYVILAMLPQTHWVDADVMFPLWSYLTFTQNFFMVATDSIGAHWLAPTWTLTVEEHFYLIAPAVFFVVPRRHLFTVFATAAVLTLLFRAAVFEYGIVSKMACAALLPGIGSGLLFGLMAAVLMATDGIDWRPVKAGVVAGSPFAAVRLRTAAAKRFKRVDNATAVIWKTLLIAEKTFRRLDAPELLADVANGVAYVNGVRAVNRGEKKAAA